MSTRALFLATLPVAALLAVVLLIGATGGGSPSGASPLVGVSAEDFEMLELVVAERDAEPGVGKAEAREIAGGHGGGEVRQVLLARTHRHDTADRGRLTWVVNFEPRTALPIPNFGPGVDCHGQPLSTDPKDQRVIYSLAYINANTGGITGRGMALHACEHVVLEGLSAEDLYEFSISLEPPEASDHPEFNEEHVMELPGRSRATPQYERWSLRAFTSRATSSRMDNWSGL